MGRGGGKWRRREEILPEQTRDLNQDETDINKSKPSGTEQVQGKLRQDQSHLKLTQRYQRGADL